MFYSSYASGRKPWKNGEDGYERQSYSDGKLEVVGFHTAGFVMIFSNCNLSDICLINL
jgi:hypothetical protein